MIQRIENSAERAAITRTILEALPDWFGVPESREKYIAESAEQIMVADVQEGVPRGFLCLKPTGRDTAELAVMGVLMEYHRQGIGRRLFQAALEIVRAEGYSFLQVKTVQMGRYPDYDRTNLFYLSLGFREFEVFPTLWDEANPCQVYVMYIG